MSADENAEAAADITKDVEPNYLDPNFILQNLAICSTEKLYDQPPFTIRAKQRLAEIVSLQAVFYTMLCLKAFIGCDMAPSIVIIGTGTIGTAIIDLLTKCGCQPYMYIYSRSDVAAKQWRDRGYKSHHIISRLLRGVNADIFIFAFNLQSFPSVCRQIIDMVTPQSACINTIFGLNRKRILRVLRINTVYRTYVEAAVISRRLECDLKDLVADARSHVTVGDVKSVVKEFFSEGGVLSDLGQQKGTSGSVPGHAHGHNDHDSEAHSDEDSSFHLDLDYDSDSEYVDLEKDVKLSVMEEAGQLIARRHEGNIVDIIKLAEYFNSVRGMPHPLARREAIESVLGDIIEEGRERVPVLNPHIVPGGPPKDGSGPGSGTGKSRPNARGGASSQTLTPTTSKPNTPMAQFGQRKNSKMQVFSTVASAIGQMGTQNRKNSQVSQVASSSTTTNSPCSTSPRRPSAVSAPPSALNTPAVSKKDLMKKQKSTKILERTESMPSFPVNKTSPLLNLWFPLTECIMRIHKLVGTHFQQYFSRYILIKDIPSPIKEHPHSELCMNAPEWPPEPVYFNNILDIYADRSKENISIHDEDAILDLYGSDTIVADAHSRGFDLLQKLDEDSDNDNRGLKEMDAPSRVERETREIEYAKIEAFVNGPKEEDLSPRTRAIMEEEEAEKAAEAEMQRLADEREYIRDQNERNAYALDVAKDLINRDEDSPVNDDN